MKDSGSMWDILGDGVITVHYAFLVYLLVGGFLALRWRWTVVPYALAVVWAVVVVSTNVACPLTALQNQLREASGKPPLTDSFINLYVQGVAYPQHYEAVAQAAVAVVVAVSLTLFWRRRPDRHPPIQRGATGTAVGTTPHR
jgi:Protein of Unknown function (DUF2784)